MNRFTALIATAVIMSACSTVSTPVPQTHLTPSNALTTYTVGKDPSVLKYLSPDLSQTERAYMYHDLSMTPEKARQNVVVFDSRDGRLHANRPSLLRYAQLLQPVSGDPNLWRDRSGHIIRTLSPQTYDGVQPANCAGGYCHKRTSSGAAGQACVADYSCKHGFSFIDGKVTFPCNSMNLGQVTDSSGKVWNDAGYIMVGEIQNHDPNVNGYNVEADSGIQILPGPKLQAYLRVVYGSHQNGIPLVFGGDDHPNCTGSNSSGIINADMQFSPLSALPAGQHIAQLILSAPMMSGSYSTVTLQWNMGDSFILDPTCAAGGCQVKATVGLTRSNGAPPWSLDGSRVGALTDGNGWAPQIQWTQANKGYFDATTGYLVVPQGQPNIVAADNPYSARGDKPATLCTRNSGQYASLETVGLQLVNSAVQDTNIPFCKE